MKRLKTSDSMGMVRSPNYPLKEEEEEHTENNGGYSKEFLAMLDSYDHEDYGEEIPVKKRRLSLHQVKALEVSFEAGNKLDPERKVKLAEELSLEPRQVAIWFQNRRARWKNRQLDRDYGTLKAKFDALKHDYDCLERQNRALAEKLKVLKAKACGDSSESSESMRDDQSPILVYKDLSDHGDNAAGVDLYKTLKSKDCVSDSGDSVGPMKEESNGNDESSLGYNGHSFSSTSMVNCLQYTGYHHQTQFVRMDDQSLFTPEESYNFFSVDQAPSLHWLQ